MAIAKTVESLVHISRIQFNPFTAELFFKAWHVSGNLVLQINLTVKYLETIYENVPHALRNSATYHISHTVNHNDVMKPQSQTKLFKRL